MSTQTLTTFTGIPSTVGYTLPSHCFQCIQTTTLQRVIWTFCARGRNLIQTRRNEEHFGPSLARFVYYLCMVICNRRELRKSHMKRHVHIGARLYRTYIVVSSCSSGFELSKDETNAKHFLCSACFQALDLFKALIVVARSKSDWI